jgi:glyoxylase-like metal-dependent hydrolase (beta-lactamase superfamily II)
MADARFYRKALEDLGGGVYAWMQPDGSWGYSNAGLITDGEECLLVDTLFDLALTREMLAAMQDATPAAQTIDALVNTHANGDHTFGNQLVRGAHIIASRSSAREMEEATPAVLAGMMQNADRMGAAGDYLKRIFGAFEFEGIESTLPTQTFDGELTHSVGDKQIQLIEVGPAHTRGDVLVHDPEDEVIFTGDILFIDGTPLMWEGPVENWIRACDRIIELEPRVIVPGHGPLTDTQGVREVQRYLVYIHDEARLRFEAGLSAKEASRDIALSDFSSWLDSERIVINVHTLYREFGSEEPTPDLPTLFALMSELA